MSEKLAEVLALSNGQRVAQSIQLDDFPELAGSRPDQIQRFNEQMKEWKRRTEVRLSEQATVPTEQSGQ